MKIIELEFILCAFPLNVDIRNARENLANGINE
jgi:hypothetical protein